jgi:hypothetical protein
MIAPREFDIATRKLPPAFDSSHVSLFGIAHEKVARFRARLVAWQREGLAHIAVLTPGPASHPRRQISRFEDHVATPTDGDDMNIGLLAVKPSPGTAPARFQRATNRVP